MFGKQGYHLATLTVHCLNVLTVLHAFQVESKHQQTSDIFFISGFLFGYT